MSQFLHHIALTAPAFILILIGYFLVRWRKWPPVLGDALTRFVFTLAIPCLLFRMMSDATSVTSVDQRLLIAFFGGCLTVFLIGRFIAWKIFRLDGTGQSIFALGGIFSNNVLLGVPLAKALLGDAAVPAVALVLIFNTATLWTLVTISVEWAKQGNLSFQGLKSTLKGVLTNPVVLSISIGTLFGRTNIVLPNAIDTCVAMLAQAAVPLALVALGMGLAEFGIRSDWRLSSAIAMVKLVLQPLVVWVLAILIGLGPLETKVVVLLASIGVGTNVYLMARQFKALEGPVAASLVLTTIIAALTTPLIQAVIS